MSERTVYEPELKYTYKKNSVNVDNLKSAEPKSNLNVDDFITPENNATPRLLTDSKKTGTGFVLVDDNVIRQNTTKQEPKLLENNYNYEVEKRIAEIAPNIAKKRQIARENSQNKETTVNIIGNTKQEYNPETTQNVSDVNDVFGEEFQGYTNKPQKAIEKLLQTQSGHIKSAVYKEGIGDIDLVWGNSDMGLKHIIERRNSEGKNGIDFVKNIPEIIENGLVDNKDASTGRKYIVDNDRKVVIRLDYDKKTRNWLVSAFEKKENNGRHTMHIHDSNLNVADGVISTTTPANSIITNNSNSFNSKDVAQNQHSTKYPQISYDIMPSGQVRKVKINGSGYDNYGNGNAEHFFLTPKEYEKETGKKYSELQPETSDSVEILGNNDIITKRSEFDEQKTIDISGSPSRSEGIQEGLSNGVERISEWVDGRTSNRGNLSANKKQSGSARSTSNLGDNNFPIKQEHEQVINKKYGKKQEENEAIEKFIKEKEYEKYDVIPEEIKTWLKKYSGAGGLGNQGASGKGILSEYYTPQNIVNKMWDLTNQYIDTDGSKILEPSVGIGRFLENAPKNSEIEAFEINPVSAKIAEILYPNAKINLKEFETKYIENNKSVKNVKPEYDIVIGNPPYGKHSGMYAAIESGYGRFENYFISRGVQSLKENGIMTFIVPSGYLKATPTVLNKSKFQNDVELLDAYRLPNNTFDRTGIGTDIIVLRKKTGNNTPDILHSDNWFKQHPEKILGNVEKGKGQWGADIVSGDKNSVNKINTSKKSILKTEKSVNNVENTVKNSTKSKTSKSTGIKTVSEKPKQSVEYETYKHKNTASKEEIQLFSDTKVDGTLPKDKYEVGTLVNQYKDNLYNDFNYLQGNIYEKLEQLEKENISPEQKEIQKEKLVKVLPKPKKINEITLNPLSDFVQDLNIEVDNPKYKQNGYYRSTKAERELNQYDKEKISLTDSVIQYVSDERNITKGDLEGVLRDNVIKYLRGKQIKIDYSGLPAEKYCTPAQKSERKQRVAQQSSDCRQVANKLFNEFARNELPQETISNIESVYNKEYNGTYNTDYLNMPLIVEDVSAIFKNKPLELRNAQIEGINFLNNQGVGLLGFDVGVGKTLTAIISTVQNMKMGRCKRPVIFAPQPTIKKGWEKEIKDLYPNLKINILGNLGKSIKFDGKIEDGTVTICSYQALENIWYEKGTVEKLVNNLYEISDKNTTNKQEFGKEGTAREKETLKADVEKMVGEALKGNSQKYTFEQLGFDHITVDEAHNFKNLFAVAKAYNDKGTSYNVNGGRTSNRAIRMFLATQHILSNNNNRNVYLLSATPFTNKPLEIFNMFSYIAKDMLDKMHCNNVHQFIETFADMKAVDIVNDKNEIVTKDECIGFKNKDILYHIRDKFFMMRKGNEAELKRPDKHTVKVVLEPNEKQKELIENAENAISDTKNKGAEVLKRISIVRNATLSPDIATNNLNVTPNELINNSPKLKYIAEAVKSQHEYDKYACQIIYSPRGVEFFPKIKQYFIDNGIFENDEIAIIDGSTNEDKVAEYIDSFNEKEGKLKLIIGSSTINEGVNLNGYSTTLYLPFTDWNPTQHQQVEGRIWRSGNNYKDCRIVLPLLKDSSDPFLFQKLSTKISRINDALYSDGESFIDPEELDTDAQRLSLITNPSKKAKAFVFFEQKKLNSEKTSLAGRLDSVKQVIENKKNAESNIKYYTNEIEDYNKIIKEIEERSEKDENGDLILTGSDTWRYENYKSQIESSKKYLKNNQSKLKKIENLIKTREYDLNGNDKPEIIENKINNIQEKIDNLKEIEEKKKQEYQIEYEKQAKEAKSIESHIEDFKKVTHELYDGFTVDSDYSLIDDIKGSAEVISETVENIKFVLSNGKKIKDLTKEKNIFGTLNDIANVLNDDIFQKAGNAKVSPMYDTTNKKLYGTHTDIFDLIEINTESVGNDPVFFTRIFMHELSHSRQYAKYREIRKKQLSLQKLTKDEIQYIKDYKECRKVNTEKTSFYSKDKRIIDKHLKKHKFRKSTQEENENYLSSISRYERNIVKQYLKIFKNYENTRFEVEARQDGEKYAEEIRKQYTLGGRNRRAESVGTRDRERSVGTGHWDLSSLESHGRGKSYLLQKSSGREGLGFEGLDDNNIVVYDKLNDVNDIKPKIKDGILDKSSKVGKNTLTPISSRLDEINPKIKHAERKFEFRLGLGNTEYLSDVEPFLTKVSNMSKSDYAKYDLALKNSNKNVIFDLNIKYGLGKEYLQVRKTLDKIRKEAIDAGMEVGFIDDYFPRKIINPSKYLEDISKSTYIKKLLNDIDPNNTLTII